MTEMAEPVEAGGVTWYLPGDAYNPNDWPAVRPPAEHFARSDRVLHFYSGPGHNWPLWEWGDEAYAMTPDDYGLSADLVALLARCHTLWSANYDGVAAWHPREAAQEHRDACNEAVEMLRIEVHPITVVLE